MALEMSEMGLPILVSPFSIILASGESVLRQRSIVDSILPSCMQSFMFSRKLGFSLMIF